MSKFDSHDVDNAKIITEQGFKVLLSAVRNDPDPSARQTEILFQLAYLLGLRVGEVTRLRWGDFDRIESRVTIAKSKRGKTRTIMFGEGCESLLRQLESQLSTTPSPTRSLFYSRRGVMGIRCAQRLFQKYRDIAGLSKKLSFHSLRHGAATRLLNRGLNISMLRDLLGHSSVATTNVYLHKTESALAHQRRLL